MVANETQKQTFWFHRKKRNEHDYYYRHHYFTFGGLGNIFGASFDERTTPDGSG
jgi:hypothetical protein